MMCWMKLFPLFKVRRSGHFFVHFAKFQVGTNYMMLKRLRKRINLRCKRWRLVTYRRTGKHNFSWICIMASEQIRQTVLRSEIARFVILRIETKTVSRFEQNGIARETKVLLWQRLIATAS